MSQPLITALIPGTGFPGLDDYRSRQAAFYSDDYGQRARYRQHNEALLQQNRSPQVVFFGTSTVVLAGKPPRRCWCAFARTC